MYRRYCFALIATVFIAADCFAALPSVVDWDIAGEWSAYGYHNFRNSHIDDKVMSDSRIVVENRIGWKEQDIVLKADLEWRFQTYHGMDDQNRGKVRFRDVYAELKKEQYDVAIGQKRVTWGKLDDIVILDRISPQDLRHFVLYDKQERKDPALMVQHQWFGWEGIQLETIFLPVFQPSEMDFFGTNWAAFGHLKGEVASNPNYTVDQKNIVSGISIQDDEGVTSQSLKNSQAAVRLRGRAGDVDYGIYYLNLYHAVPVLRETNAAGNLTKQFLFEPTVDHLNALVSAGASGDDLRLTKAHPRVNALGADWETVLGLLGLRGEMAVFFGLPYLRNDFSYVEKDQVSFGVGIDHTTADQWYFDAQYIQDFILNYESLYSTEELPYSFAGTISKGFSHGRVMFGLDWIWQVSYDDVMLNPELTYKWERAGVDIAVGFFIFEGNATKTLFGRYDANDVVYVKVSGKF